MRFCYALAWLVVVALLVPGSMLLGLNSWPAKEVRGPVAMPRRVTHPERPQKLRLRWQGMAHDDEVERALVAGAPRPKGLDQETVEVVIQIVLAVNMAR